MRRQNPNPLFNPNRVIRPICLRPINTNSQIPDPRDYSINLSDLSDSSDPTNLNQNSGSTSDLMPVDNSSQLSSD